MRYVLLAAIALSAFSCRTDSPSDGNNNNPSEVKDMRDLQVANNFDYSTSSEGTMMVEVRSIQNTPMNAILVEMYSDDPLEGGRLLVSGQTDLTGMFFRSISVPDYLDSVYLRVNAIGMVNELMVPVINGGISHVFGGPQTGGGKRKSNKTSGFVRIPHEGKYYYMGSFDGQGVPNYLEPVNDIIDAAFLQDITAAFPEKIEIDTSLISDQYDHDLHLGQQSDVWVTWVHEGAGYKNTLAFYKYDSNNPPTSVNDVDSIFIIFPNMSYGGSGGNLASGNKVHLGTYDAGTSIGWLLIANAWNGSTVRTNFTHFYSNPDFNQVPDPNLRQHHVMLYDNDRDLVLTAYEDIYRGCSDCDKDFNDAIFYVTSNPVTAISGSTNLPSRATATDRDNDGVANYNDDYPDDGNKAFDNFSYGSLAYEDLWPGEGDYDFNDLVTEYSINTIANASGDIVEIEMNFSIEAIGAGSNNGFAVQIDNLTPFDVASASLPSTMAGTIALNANNTEAGQQRAVIWLADKLFDVMSPSQGVFVNTLPGNPYVTPVTLTATVSLASPVDPSALGSAPFNPFLVVAQERGREVHLPDSRPTDLANNGLFGSQNDDSKPNQNRYYKTDLNLPWAMHLSGPVSFNYPVEYVEILDAYLDFASWAQTSGVQNANWYTSQGRINSGNIY